MCMYCEGEGEGRVRRKRRRRRRERGDDAWPSLSSDLQGCADLGRTKDKSRRTTLSVALLSWLPRQRGARDKALQQEEEERLPSHRPSTCFEVPRASIERQGDRSGASYRPERSATAHERQEVPPSLDEEKDGTLCTGSV